MHNIMSFSYSFFSYKLQKPQIWKFCLECEIVSSISDSGNVVTYITDGNWALDSIRAMDVPREWEKKELSMKQKFELKLVRMRITLNGN